MGTGGSSQLSPLNRSFFEGLFPQNYIEEVHWSLSNLLRFLVRSFEIFFKLRPRSISTGSLHALPHFHFRPIYLIVFKGSYSLLMRSLISGQVSRLDAFSVYPFRMQLSSRTAGAITGTPLIRPLRSSRTRSSPLQTSCARDGYEPNCLTTF